MASFSYVVDTDPMARSIDGVSTQVEGTTVAVVGMQAAVIAAEVKAAEGICENVNRGFYSQILSQISQKQAAAKSEMDAKLIELSYLRAKLGKVRDQFEADFHRISGRYARFFRSLDEMLRARVGELDCGSVVLGVGELRALEGRNLTVGSRVPVLQTETLSASQALANAQVKLHCVGAIGSMANVIERTVELKRGAGAAIMPGRVEARLTLAVPLVLLEADDLNLRDTVQQVLAPGAVPGAWVPDCRAAAIAAAQAGRKDLVWSTPGDDDAGRVRSNCLGLLAVSPMGDREKTVFGRLLGGSAWLSVG